MNDMTPHEVFVATRELLSDPGHWCKFMQGADSRGKFVNPGSDDAVSWCMLGAFARVKGEALFHGSSSPEVRILADNLAECTRPWSTRPWMGENDGWKVADWNNSPETTHETIMAKLDEMVELTRPWTPPKPAERVRELEVA